MGSLKNVEEVLTEPGRTAGLMFTASIPYTHIESALGKSCSRNQSFGVLTRRGLIPYPWRLQYPLEHDSSWSLLFILMFSSLAIGMCPIMVRLAVMERLFSRVCAGAWRESMSMLIDSMR